ncbi:MAG: hypothetical protein MJE77_23320 [Proteobacteria bacterium]|nr:hypothetical protein [Pseudomonadota bacterium]
MEFTDPTFRECVLLYAASIGAEYVHQIERLQCSGSNTHSIGSIAGIQSLTRLREVTFNNNPITDWTPLSSISALEAINIIKTPTSDLAAFRSLPSLEILAAQECQIEDVTPLGNMLQLRRIFLTDNDIKKGVGSLTGLSDDVQQIDLLNNLNVPCTDLQLVIDRFPGKVLPSAAVAGINCVN